MPNIFINFSVIFYFNRYVGSHKSTRPHKENIKFWEKYIYFSAWSSFNLIHIFPVIFNSFGTLFEQSGVFWCPPLELITIEPSTTDSTTALLANLLL